MGRSKSSKVSARDSIGLEALFHRTKGQDFSEEVVEERQEGGAYAGINQPSSGSREFVHTNDLADDAGVSLENEVGSLDEDMKDYDQPKDAEHDHASHADLTELGSIIQHDRSDEDPHADEAGLEKERVGPYDES